MRRLIGIVAALVCLFGVFHVALAHALLTAAEPAAGETLPATPARILLTFSEPVGADSEIRVVAADFRPISNMPATTRLAPNQLVVELPALNPGVYTVEYDTLSVDGHTIRGAYEFAIEPETIFGRLQWQSIVIGALIGVVARFALRRLRKSDILNR